MYYNDDNKNDNDNGSYKIHEKKTMIALQKISTYTVMILMTVSFKDNSYKIYISDNNNMHSVKYFLFGYRSIFSLSCNSNNGNIIKRKRMTNNYC